MADAFYTGVAGTQTPALTSSPFSVQWTGSSPYFGLRNAKFETCLHTQQWGQSPSFTDLQFHTYIVKLIAEHGDAFMHFREAEAEGL
jgi:hypothetical protein